MFFTVQSNVSDAVGGHVIIRRVRHGGGELQMRIESIKPHMGNNDAARLDGVLESLLKLCIEAGAQECAVVECGDLIFVGRAGEAADVPAGERSIFWPVPRFPRDSIGDALRQYRKAVVFGLNVKVAGSRADAMKSIYDIATRVESACFYGGYYLAIGLAVGNCKEVFCEKENKCQALTVGKPCRYALRSRPSIEACGLDMEAIAVKAGWKDLDPSAFLMGMVFVA
jgi:predicted metal-binding protein